MYSRVSYSIESSDPDNSVLIDRAISRVHGGAPAGSLGRLPNSVRYVRRGLVEVRGTEEYSTEGPICRSWRKLLLGSWNQRHVNERASLETRRFGSLCLPPHSLECPAPLKTIIACAGPRDPWLWTTR